MSVHILLPWFHASIAWKDHCASTYIVPRYIERHTHSILSFHAVRNSYSNLLPRAFQFVTKMVCKCVHCSCLSLRDYSPQLDHDHPVILRMFSFMTLLTHTKRVTVRTPSNPVPIEHRLRRAFYLVFPTPSTLSHTKSSVNSLSWPPPPRVLPVMETALTGAM